jgi:hypothetical protein
MPKWSDVLGVVAKVAPTLATAAGGPLAGSAVSMLEAALGVKPGSSDVAKRQDEIAAAVAGATPEQLLALKQADHDFQIKMTELGFADAEALAELNVRDRDSARQREIAVKDWTPRLLAAGVTLGFFTILGFLLLRSVPSASKDVLDIMLGSLGTAWVSIVAYYFGSSAGSSEKTKLLAKAQPVE